MKNIYRTFLIFMTLTIFILFLGKAKSVFNTALPEVKLVITVLESDNTKSNSYIYQQLKEFSVKESVDIHKLVFKSGKDGIHTKNIYTFSKKTSSSYYFEENNTFFYDSKNLKNESIKGTYILTENTPVHTMENLFKNLGLTFETKKISFFDIILATFFDTSGIISIIVLLCSLILGFFSKLSFSKKYGILQLHGIKIYKAILIDIIFDISIIFLCSIIFIFMDSVYHKYYLFLAIILSSIITIGNFLSTILCLKTSNIIEKIKGKKNYQLLLPLTLFLKFVIFIIFIIFTFSLSNQVKNTQIINENLTLWKNFDEFYTLQFSAYNDLLPRNTQNSNDLKSSIDDSNQKMLPLMNLAEKEGALLSVNNEHHFNRSAYGSYFASQSLLIVNNNFLDLSNLKGENNHKIKNLEKTKAHVIIPKNLENEKNEIIKEAKNVISLYTSVENNLDIIFSKSNQEVFNFNSEFPEYSVSKNPILIVISLEILGSNVEVLTSNISQGNYLFKYPDNINNYIEKNGLQSEFTGLASSRDTALKLLNDNENQLFLLTLFLIVLFINYLIIAIYSCKTYIETERKLIFLKYINGLSYFSRHGYFLTLWMSISFFSSIILTFYNENFFYLVILPNLIDLLIFILIVLIVEKNTRIDIIKGGES